MRSAPKIKDNGRMLLFLYMAALFVALSPDVLARFPKNCSKLVVAATHGAAFILVFWFTHKFVMRLGRRMGYEGFQTTPTSMDTSSGSMPMPPSPMANIPGMIPPPISPTLLSSGGAMPMPSGLVDSANQPLKLSPMNIIISTGSGKTGNTCNSGNDCASGMCMANKCL